MLISMSTCVNFFGWTALARKSSAISWGKRAHSFAHVSQLASTYPKMLLHLKESYALTSFDFNQCNIHFGQYRQQRRYAARCCCEGIFRVPNMWLYTAAMFAVASCDIARSVCVCMYIHMYVCSTAIHIVVHQLQQNNAMQLMERVPQEIFINHLNVSFLPYTLPKDSSALLVEACHARVEHSTSLSYYRLNT